MFRLKSALTGGFLTLIVCLMIMAVLLAMTGTRAIQAEAAAQSAIPAAQESSYYAPLTDAPPQRDITTQRLAPLAETP
jgi:hypothetical protein